MGGSALQIATLLAFFISVMVAALHLNQIAFSVAQLFLESSSDVAKTLHVTVHEIFQVACPSLNTL